MIRLILIIFVVSVISLELLIGGIGYLSIHKKEIKEFRRDLFDIIRSIFNGTIFN